MLETNFHVLPVLCMRIFKVKSNLITLKNKDILMNFGIFLDNY